MFFVNMHELHTSVRMGVRVTSNTLDTELQPLFPINARTPLDLSFFWFSRFYFEALPETPPEAPSFPPRAPEIFQNADKAVQDGRFHAPTDYRIDLPYGSQEN